MDATERIKQEIETVRASLDSLEDSRDAVAPDVSLGRLTRMDALQSKAVREDGREKALARLRSLEAALERTRNGDYGICTSCGESIAPARLEFMPEASLCVSCA